MVRFQCLIQSSWLERSPQPKPSPATSLDEKGKTNDDSNQSLCQPASEGILTNVSAALMFQTVQRRKMGLFLKAGIPFQNIVLSLLQDCNFKQFWRRVNIPKAGVNYPLDNRFRYSCSICTWKTYKVPIFREYCTIYNLFDPAYANSFPFTLAVIEACLRPGIYDTCTARIHISFGMF